MGVASHHYLFQSYGLVERLLDEGNQMHMAVRISDFKGHLSSHRLSQAFYNPSPNGGIEVRQHIQAADIAVNSHDYHIAY